jgi:hypothetical protein
MKQFFRSLRRATSAAVFLSLCVAGSAQRKVRLAGPITGGPQVQLQGSKPGRALAANDLGALGEDTQVAGVTLVFNRTAAQQTALETLLAAQQDPASPLYHQWLTPVQFGQQFGMSDTDLAAVESWLTGQGFSIVGVTPAKDRLTFSGTARQVNAAFGTSLHRYRSDSRVDYAPSTDLALPGALAPMVAAVLHVSTFRPHAMVKAAPVVAKPDYTTANNAQHFLTPKDVATMYDVNTTYSAGFTGTGQSIAIAGETYIQLADVQNFQTAAGLTANLPTLVLEPNTGGSATYEGDEFESDIDVEYASGMAPGANVMLVYTGDSPNYGVFDAFDYAIEENLAPVVSISYGSCEPLFGQANANAANNLFQQAAAQGQTLIASAGDEGSTNCFGYTDNNGNALSAATQQQLAINFPADSPYVTAIGGTQMAAGTYGAGASQYWASASSTAVPNSLLSYVPEVVWNETSTTYGLASGGGGISTLFTIPSYQKALVSNQNFRLNPDISLQASVGSPGYLACTSDPSAYANGQTSADCAQGIYDTTGKYVTRAGGTSFGAPIFAGLMAVLNQVKHGTGQGAVNTTLYSLAGNTTTYASVYHDITSGNNGCAALTGYCTAGLTQYQAGAGFDEATGLGTIDFGNLLAAWPASSASVLAGTTVSLTPATASPASGASDVITIKVNSATGGTATGTVNIYVANEAAPLTTSNPASVPAASLAASVTLTNGQGTYTFPGTTVGGTQVITATYTGDSTHASSTSTVALTLANTITPTGSFSFSVPSITVPANGVGQSTLSVSASGGYNGLINFTLPGLPAADCFEVTYSAIPASSPIVLYIGNGSVCSSTAAVRVGSQLVHFTKGTAKSTPPALPWRGAPETAMAAGLLASGLFFRRRKSRRLPTLLALAGLSLFVSLGLGGCGGSSGNVVTPPSGGGSQTLTLTLQGTDSVNTSIASSASFTATIQ